MPRKSVTRRRLISWLSALGGVWGSRRPAAAGPGRLEAEPQSGDRPVKVALAGIDPGSMVEVAWQGQPVFVRHRTAEEIARERAVPLEQLRDPARDQARVRRPEWVVVEGVCTHGGCIPHGPMGDYGGWYCLCHGSQFDTAGRVRAGPARENLGIPPYAFTGESALTIGVRGGTGMEGAGREEEGRNGAPRDRDGAVPGGGEGQRSNE